jgi:hypothetical protein
MAPSSGREAKSVQATSLPWSKHWTRGPPHWAASVGLDDLLDRSLPLLHALARRSTSVEAVPDVCYVLTQRAKRRVNRTVETQALWRGDERKERAIMVGPPPLWACRPQQGPVRPARVDRGMDVGLLQAGREPKDGPLQQRSASVLGRRDVEAAADVRR